MVNPAQPLSAAKGQTAPRAAYSDRKIFVNGEMVPAREAKISVFDHGFLYGDGVFEGIRAYNGRVFKLEDHLKRLYDSAKAIMLTIPYAPQELQEIILRSIRANDLRDAYIRVVVSRGVGDLGLDPLKCATATVVVIADSVTLYPDSAYQNGLQLASATVRRPATDVLNPAVKSLNYLNNIMAKLEANLRGLPEVVMLSAQGYVLEGTGDNIFIVREGVLLTPPTNLGILNGVTRRTVLTLAEELGIPYQEAVFSLYDLYTAEECFLTGTAAELIPAVGCDGRVIGEGVPGPVFKRLHEAFFAYARSTGVDIYPGATLEVGE